MPKDLNTLLLYRPTTFFENARKFRYLRTTVIDQNNIHDQIKRKLHSLESSASRLVSKNKA